MSDEITKANAGPDEEKAQRKARSERMTQMMWAYICGGIALLSIPVGLEATFIPLGFGVLGCVLAWQMMSKGERRHGPIAGAINLGAILIWLTYNWPMIRHYLGI
jgi:hypothetical protein